MRNIRLNRVFHASWKISTRMENSHDVLTRKPISDELIDMSGLTCLVLSEKGEEHYALFFICASDTKNIQREI